MHQYQNQNEYLQNSTCNSPTFESTGPKMHQLTRFDEPRPYSGQNIKVLTKHNFCVNFEVTLS